jgi:hypothetical protein
MIVGPFCRIVVRKPHDHDGRRVPAGMESARFVSKAFMADETSASQFA